MYDDDGVYHTITLFLRAQYLHSSWNWCRCEKCRRWKHLAESVPEDVSLDIGTPLLVEQQNLETPPRGCAIYMSNTVPAWILNMNKSHTAVSPVLNAL